MLFRTRRFHRRALLAIAVCVVAVALIPATASASGSNASLPKVMTRNLYLGADLNPAIAALGCTPAPFCTFDANQTIWNQVVATDFPARAKKLAKEIDDDDPYIVGLQEVALWRSGPVNGVKDATTVEYDFLADAARRADGARQQVQGVRHPAGGGHREPGGQRLARLRRSEGSSPDDARRDPHAHRPAERPRLVHQPAERELRPEPDDPDPDGVAVRRHRVHARLDVARHQDPRPSGGALRQHAPRVGRERHPPAPGGRARRRLRQRTVAQPEPARDPRR